MNVIKHFVNGQLFDGNSKRKGKVFNPATGDQNSEVNLATTNDVNIAVESAHKAFQKWKKIPARERGKMVAAGAKKLEERKSEIETLLLQRMKYELESLKQDKDVKNIMSKVSKSDLEPEEAVNLIFKLFNRTTKIVTHTKLLLLGHHTH